MSFIRNIPRGLRLLTVMAVLGILIWQFAAGTQYFFYGIGAAVLVTFGMIVLVYKPFQFSRTSRSSKHGADSSAKSKTSEENAIPDTIEIEPDYTDTPSIMRSAPVMPFSKVRGQIDSSDIRRVVSPTSKMNTEVEPPLTGPAADTKSSKKLTNGGTATTATPQGSIVTPSIPLVDDETSLTEEDKNQLVNAVWYRCENPYCKYTSFLGVHHILDEKEGGSNRLENLIVLCPYCHDLAHRHEIPEQEMRDWISNRENRFKFKPDWKYF